VYLFVCPFISCIGVVDFCSIFVQTNKYNSKAISEKLRLIFFYVISVEVIFKSNDFNRMEQKCKVGGHSFVKNAKKKTH